MVSMLEILKLAFDKKASDIHITAGCPPALRINGNIYRLDTDPLNAEQSKKNVLFRSFGRAKSLF